MRLRNRRSFRSRRALGGPKLRERSQGRHHQNHKQPHSLLLRRGRAILSMGAERFAFDPLEFFLRFVLLQLWKHSTPLLKHSHRQSAAKFSVSNLTFFILESRMGV